PTLSLFTLCCDYRVLPSFPTRRSSDLVWLLKETVLALHARLLAEFGGSSGLRDEGLLESALARPQHLFAYGRATLFDLAACYARSEEHTSELQSLRHLVCRLLLEKKKK